MIFSLVFLVTLHGIYNNGIFNVNINAGYNQCPVSMQTIFAQCDNLSNRI